jgi:branched-chain amino acid transport system permease protein
MSKGNLVKFGGLAAFTVLLVILPFLVKEYYVHVLITLLVNIIVVVSFRLITTMGGWSMAHIPLMGLGAYTSAILTKMFGWSFWVALPLGGFASAVVALIFSYPLMRITGFAFFIASSAAGEAMRLSWTRLRMPFGGHEGIAGIMAPSSFLGIDFSQPISYYYLVMVIGALCLLIMRWLENSRIGDTFKAIASHGDLSKSIGINLAKYKTMAFVIGSFFAGIAGVLFVHFWHAVDPVAFGFVNTMYMVVWVVLGGVSTFLGPIIGLTVMTIVHQLLLPLYVWLPLFYGVILILTMLFLPEGMESLPKRVSLLVRKVRGIIQQKSS